MPFIDSLSNSLASFSQAEKLRQEEKETARLNESLQLMHLKYASRENVFKALQEKVKFYYCLLLHFEFSFVCLL